jgi:putative sigma-54 modulation protein
MNLNYSFKHMNVSDAIKEYARERTETLNRFFNGKVHVTWNFSVEKQNHVARCHVLGSNIDIFGESVTDNMHGSIDLAIDRVEKQLRKHKEIVTNHHHKAG